MNQESAKPNNERRNRSMIGYSSAGMETQYRVTWLRKNLIQIENDVGDCCSLILGSEKAVLFDTMCGLGDLKGLLESLTSLPLTVICSHGHYDHMGGICQFDAVYMSREDWGIAEKTLPYLDEIQANMGKDLSNARRSLLMSDRLRDIRPGETFDLGEITARVVPLRGHTAGSIGLFLPELRILLVGDAASPTMCLFFPDSLGIEEYQKTLRRMMELDFDEFVQGHYSKLFRKSVLEKFWQCTLLPGRKHGYEYINSRIPEYRGKLYMLELYNPELDSMICLIDKN